MAAAATATATATAAAMALAKIERAHQMYREGRHLEALESYTEALSVAKTKAQKIALHSNRAACYLKIHDFRKAAEECTSVLELDHQHTGALMLRAQTLVTLKEYQSALFDVNRLMELNPSSEVYKNLQARLKTQLSLAPIPESEEETLIDEEELHEEQEKTDIEVPLTARCSESVSGAVEYLKTNDEAESNQQEVTSEDDTNKFDGHRETRSDETETATFHAQETLAQNKNNEPLTSMQKATVACRPDTDKHASLNAKEQKAMPQPMVQQKANPKEQKAIPQSIVQQKANTKEQKAVPQPIIQQKANPKEQKAMPQPIIQQKANPKEQKAMPQPIVQHKAIPQPVGRSRLDYSRWDQVDSDSSDDEEEDDDDDDDVQPRYRFRVRTFGVCPVK